MKYFMPFFRVSVIGSLVTSLLVLSCSEGVEPPAESYLDLPTQPYSYPFASSNDVATMGRVLFYDPNLSVNNSVSCSSCHKQVFAFSDNERFSKGFENVLTSRNSMPIQNAQSNLFWDGRESSLNSMVLKPVINHVEMGIHDLDKLAEKLERLPYYRELAVNAYGSPEIKSWMLSNALADFIQNIRTTSTKLDRVFMGEERLSPLEEKGKQLFVEVYDCNSCHRVEDPSGYLQAGVFANIGLDQLYNDGGVARVTNSPSDAGKFKIPSLRNVVVTGPYMHDGRFKTLEEVIDFYSDEIADNDNLDVRLRDEEGRPRRFNITASDKVAIIAFLNTLTDESMLSDPRLSNPFKPR